MTGYLTTLRSIGQRQCPRCRNTLENVVAVARDREGLIPTTGQVLGCYCCGVALSLVNGGFEFASIDQFSELELYATHIYLSKVGEAPLWFFKPPRHKPFGLTNEQMRNPPPPVIAYKSPSPPPPRVYYLIPPLVRACLRSGHTALHYIDHSYTEILAMDDTGGIFSREYQS